MMEIIYRFDGEEFKEDDLIQVIKRDVFTEEKNEIVGTYLPFFMETFAEMENEPEE